MTRLMLALLAIASLFRIIPAQLGGRIGTNPPLEDVAKFKPISTTPPSATCGMNGRADFCAPVDSEEGLRENACNIKICNQGCPGRDRENDAAPRFLKLLEGDAGTCVTPDFADMPRRGSASYVFLNDRACRFIPSGVPRMGRRGHFTMAVWLKQRRGNAGVILEKIAGPGRHKQVVFLVLVGSFSIVLQYRAVDGRPQYKMIPVNFPSDNWQHLAIQVYGTAISVFINGVETDGTPFATSVLESRMTDINNQPIIRVGQRVREWNATSFVALGIQSDLPTWSNTTGQYVGRMQDFRWYDRALTNSEIEEIATGVFPEVNILPNCLCPEGFPRVHPLEQRYCIPNGVPDTSPQRRLRVDPDAHPLAYINDDDSSTTWISSLGIYMPGGLTININLENGEYEIFYIVLQFYSPQPKGITISRFSNDTDGDMQLWGHFADDCRIRFRYENNQPLNSPTDVNCIQFPPEHEIPYQRSNITFNLLSQPPNARPGYNDFYGTPGLMDFVMASKVQIRLQYQYFTTPEYVNIKHQYYGMDGIKVIGRCNCNGHAEACDTSVSPYQCNCLDYSNTEGYQCERCKPLFNNKPFRIGDTDSSYDCQQCECHQHALSCHYEEGLDPNPGDHFRGGGGVCDDCLHNTAGRHCEQCATLFYRMSERALEAVDVCKPCGCLRAGVVNETMDCAKIDGQCECKPRVRSRRCNICVDGFFNLRRDNPEGCDNCNCTLSGTVNRTITCTPRTGQCRCKSNVRNKRCTDCQFGFKNLTDSNIDGCEPCNCNRVGSRDQYCDPITGQCFCKENVEGMFCDKCQNGFWGLSSTGCQPCGCDGAGTEAGTTCDKDTGQCVCKAHTQGRTCNECVDEYYNLVATNPQGCETCSCDHRGTTNASLVCDKQNGQCSCKEHVDGRVCNLCRGNTFGLRATLVSGCEACNCDPRGTSLGDQLSPNELVCDSNSGQCACLPSREGRRCDQCSPGFYLPANNATGCLVCDCHQVGSVSQTCNNVTGMCPCKPAETGAGLTGRRCDECAANFWNFHPLFGTCQQCGCHAPGSESSDCNPVTGQCPCKGNVIGTHCDTCRPGSSHMSENNPMGCYSHPEQQAAPEQGEVKPRWIVVRWNPPDLPNGDILAYKLFRNDEIVYSVNDSSPFTGKQYNDTSLLPYTNYDYHVDTSNVGGMVSSPTLRVRTLAGVPTGIPPLSVSRVRARRAIFEWGEPAVAHGPIETYVLQSVTTADDDSVEVHYRGLATRTEIESLRPFTNYTFTLRACTSGGCGDSLPLVVITPEAKPAQQLPPVITPISNTSLVVSWEPPQEANGIIHQYEVMMRGKPGPDGAHYPLQKVVFQSHGAYNPWHTSSPGYNPLPQPKTNFTQNNLQPFTEYEFFVSSSNSLGSVQSPWVTARTLEGTPVAMGSPMLEAISSFEVNITWEAPDPVMEVRGNVVMYQVILTQNNTSGNPNAPPFEDVVIYSCGPTIQHFVAVGFKPYTSHNITMKLCNSISCVFSEPSRVTTLPAAPVGQAPPSAHGRDQHSIDLSWEDPAKVNGPRPEFSLMRSPVAFSNPPIEMSRGVRFPGHSYITFAPDILPRDASYSGILFWFRTYEPDCLLFLAASPLSSGGLRQEYLVIQLKDGRPWFLFDAQNNPTSVTTNNDNMKRYDDGKWHRLEVNRFNRDGYIEVDVIYTGSKTSTSGTTVIGVNDGIYVGGVPGNFTLGRPNDQGDNVAVLKSLIGCVKNIQVQRDGALGEWSNVSWDEAQHWYRAYEPWQGCPVELDRPAVHFLGRGHLEMAEKLGVLDQNAWEISLDFRTNFASGILLYATGSQDNILIVYLLNGVVRCLLSSGSAQDTEIQIDSTLPPCDGDWHELKVLNNAGQIFFRLDSVESDRMRVNFQSPSVFDLSTGLFVGGAPVQVLKELVTKIDEGARSYGGCIRNLEVDGRRINLSRDVTLAVNVDLDGCPIKDADTSILIPDILNEGSGLPQPINSTLSQNSSQCIETSITLVHTGMGHQYTDTELNHSVFTRYLYKVASANAGGQAQSDWMITRSGEGVPHTVPTPYNEETGSGREIKLEWRRPLRTNGVIDNYTLTAVEVEKDMNTSQSAVPIKNGTVVTATFNGDIHIGNITGLTPWTSYSINLKACTVSGCSNSSGSIIVTTPEEIPEGVRDPTSSVTPYNMTIKWLPPIYANGQITRYDLFHNGTVVYSGFNTFHVIPGLPIYTPQNIRLEACTLAGCNTSEEVTLYSGQLPPLYIDQPMATVRGPYTVEVRWLEPPILNGILERYILYLHDDSAEEIPPGRVVYNSTMMLLDHTLTDLIAGTQYQITVAACTGGGCTFSSPTPCRTSESVPEEIDAPTLVATSPNMIQASWSEPALPNGDITLYSLYHNDRLVHNSTTPSMTDMVDLLPWSRHTFRVRVCTARGCSFGPEASIRTLESPPQGRVQLSVTVLGASTIETMWEEPEHQNGHIMYTVICTGLFYTERPGQGIKAVRDSRNMLNSTESQEWMRINDLVPFSDYTVKVNASNSAGYVISNQRSISMPPGLPYGVNPPQLTSHSPDSILAQWEDPVRNNAPGNSMFQLLYRTVSPPGNEIALFTSETRQMSYNLTGLEAYTEYEFQLVGSNPFGSTSSGWASIYTKQDRPTSMDPPIVYEIDSWSVHVTWESPSQPNGIVGSFRLIENERLRTELPGNFTEFRADNLSPFTTYSYRVEACTEAGCTSSETSASVTTSAAAPEDFQAPTLRSDSPSSVFVSWRRPTYSHGILDNYKLERRLNTSDPENSPVTLLGSFVPSQLPRYLDESIDLRPYTSYQYRVVASTLAGGSTISEWSTIRTRPGRPGGVLAPSVVVSGSESAHIQWQRPVQENGPIIRYEISFPEPKIQIYDITQRDYNITTLIPYTSYQITITACTIGGCTESPTTDVMTDADVPRGLAPPVATPISERYVNVQWRPPTFPNGPGIYYELSRTIISQPLLVDQPSYINVTENIFTTNGLIYEDRSLQRFTTCEYRLSVFNTIGSMASNSTRVTTHAGFPSSPGVLEVAIHNHTSALLWWQPPDLFALQGRVHNYYIRYYSTRNNSDRIHKFPPATTSWVVSNLYPGTMYVFTLDVDNGAHNVTSAPVQATTDDGAPMGVGIPVINSISPSQLRVSWLAPLQPNGRIVTYCILINNNSYVTNMTEAGSYTVNNLRPYTVYNIKIEACTVYACAESNTTQATTLENNPTNIDAPTIQLAGTNSVGLEWSVPRRPNGIIRSYQIHRRAMLPCTQNQPEIDERSCTYVKCPRGQKVCSTECYSPTAKVCCGGVLYNVDAMKECCDRNYVLVRSHITDVCCGGRLHSNVEGYRCCSGKYLEVGEMEVCCQDPIEDRVSVGVGDSCCGGVPYTDNGLQICCDGSLHDGFERQCCGGMVVTSDKQCCGNTIDGAVYDQNDSNICCGLQYLPRNLTKCCEDHDTKQARAHLVLNMTSTEQKCCSTELVSSDEACCHGNGYDPQASVCADVATIELADRSMKQSCGRGSLCTLTQSMLAACDRCDFNRDQFDCFRARRLRSDTRNRRTDAICPTSYIAVYTGPPNVFTYQDTELEAYTTYEYKVVAENKVGVGESSSAEITMPQSKPSEVLPPDWTSDGRDAITLSWKPPKKPNGEITRYILLRDGLEIWRGLALRHTDSFQILSYREYEYTLRACTSVGCSSSVPVRATSVQGIPEFVSPPNALVTGPNSVLLTWLPPPRANGLLQRYTLNDTKVGAIYTIQPGPGTNLRYEHNNLEPYSTHSYILTACTSAGCTDSEQVTVTTNQAKPEGVWIPATSLPLDLVNVDLYWTEPLQPNGPIQEYRLLRRFVTDFGDADNVRRSSWQLIYAGRPTIFSYTDVISFPGAKIQYQLGAMNEAGFGLSEIHDVRMPRVVPPQQPVLEATVLSPTVIRADWSFPSSVPEFNYSVVVQRADGKLISNGLSVTTTVPNFSRRRREINEDENEGNKNLMRIIPSGNEMSKVVEGLTPHTSYHIRVMTCFPYSGDDDSETTNTTDNCNVGRSALTQTSAAPPSGQQIPTLTATGGRSVEIEWEEPLHPNGVITSYQIHRKLSNPDDGLVPIEKRIYTGEANTFTYTDTDAELVPYTEYKYRITCTSDQGDAESDWESVTTKQAVPTGISAPILQAVSAFAINATWEVPFHPNGVITSYRIEHQEVGGDPTIQRPILTALTVPSALTAATFSGLQPFTMYQVRIVAVNQAGMVGRGDWRREKTSPAPPSEVAELSVEKSEDGRSVSLTWDEPALPNGEIQIYNVYEPEVSEIPVYSGRARQFDFRRLTPYTRYTLVLESCTGPGLCTRSPTTTFWTAETIPESQSPPIVQGRTSNSVTLTWRKPARPNGRIRSYQIYRRQDISFIIPRAKRSVSTSDPEAFFQSASITRYEVQALSEDLFQPISVHRVRRQIEDPNSDGEVIFDVLDPVHDVYNYTDAGLRPYSRFQYKIRTSTSIGHVDSSWVAVETHQAPPEGISPPVVVPPADRSPTALQVSWNLPTQVNGELQTFKMQRGNSTPLSFPPDQFQYKDINLRPYTMYEYTISACTAGGCSTSEVTQARTFEQAPHYVAPPSAVAFNATSLQTTWQSPGTENGKIVSYTLYGDDNEVMYQGNKTEALITGLLPFRVYSIALEACTNSGCRRSITTQVRTLEAAPIDMAPPDLHVTGANSIEVTWQPPVEPNGNIIRYEVRRNGDLVSISDGRITRYHDFELTPGTQYSYVIVAYNSQGSVSSDPPVSETTHQSAPAGLAPPTLTATSGRFMRADWSTPVNPNGVILNYTLFVRHVTRRTETAYEFTANTFSFELGGLEPHEEYFFWLKTCTLLGCVMSERVMERTLEIPPANQNPPSVVLPHRDQVPLDISWSPPVNTNGVIRFYKLYRRRLLDDESATEMLERRLAANVTGTSYTDSDLLPYTRYRFQVTALNGAGETTSLWSAPMRSGEATPSGVPAPTFQDVSARSIQVVALDPERKNGIIRGVSIYMKQNNSDDAMQLVTSGTGQQFSLVSLNPVTTYQIAIEMCTLDTLCVRGPSAFVTTLSAPPSGQSVPIVDEVTTSNLSISWTEPAHLNGEISRYEILYRRGCQVTFPPVECHVSPTVVGYSGTSTQTVLRNLHPYTRYDFKVKSFNEYGSTESSWETVITRKSAPKYITHFIVSSNSSYVKVAWPSTFDLNSVLTRFELSDRGRVIYAGLNTVYHYRRTGPSVHKFRLTVYTDTGTTRSPVIIYNTRNNQPTTQIVENIGEDMTEIAAASVPFFQRTWFMVVMVIVAMLVMSVVIGVVFRCMWGPRSSRSKIPNQREDIMMDLSAVPPYRSDDLSMHNYSVQSCPVKSPEHPHGHINRSYSMDSLHRSTSHLMGQDISFDHSMFNPKDTVEYDDRWEHALPYDDDLEYVVRSHDTDEPMNGKSDSGIHNYCEDEETPYKPKLAMKLKDTHL
uniref:usherin isoform X1 n=1 Tax=Ciona intestinalis TaxID=7719 RepID=UPI000EF507A0|nr:usherin isoform X1 [Ciona intestinalis]|eukprot:XP_018671138.2 usherin isoform X1 [Ciona intestinalis]